MKRQANIETETIDSRMFSKDWWSQPLPARHASINAHDAGLSVQVEMMKRRTHGDTAPCITWRGNSTQFMATRFFPNGITAKRASGRFYCPGQLRGTVYPDGDDCFVFVIESCCKHESRQYFAKSARLALADDTYRSFRDALISNSSLLAGDMEGAL